MCPLQEISKYVLITIIWISIIISFGKAQVIFELLDGVYNEVVFVGETDITLRCSYNGNLTIETVTIMDQNGNNVTEEIKTICAEYRINNVAISDGGMYKCNVRYTFTDGREVTEVATLNLNVKDDTSPQCVRNGTVGEPYKHGDWILLSCYCGEMDTCSWSSTVTVNSDNRAHFLPLYEMVIHKGKAIRRVKVQYTSPTDPNTRYDCFRGSASTDRCEIGPESISCNDIIINSMETVTSTDICLPPTTEPTSKEGIFLDPMTSKVTEMEDTNSKINMPDNSVHQNTNNISYTVIVISGSLVTLLTVVIVILIVFILCGARNKRDQKARGENMTKNNTNNEDNEANRNTPYYNKGFIHSSPSVVSDDNCNGITDDSHTYDFPPMNIMNAVVTSVPDETYGEVESTQLPDVTKTGSATRSHDVSGKFRFDASDFQRRPTPSERPTRGSVLDNNDGEEDISMLYAKIDKSKRKSTLHGSRPTMVSGDDVNDVYAKVDN